MIAPNQRFKTERPYQKLVTDVGEFRYGNRRQDERGYLEPISDLFDGEVLAFNISDHPTVEFAVKPLKEALNQIPVLDFHTNVHTFNTSIVTDETCLKTIVHFIVRLVKRLVSTTPPWDCSLPS